MNAHGIFAVRLRDGYVAAADTPRKADSRTKCKVDNVNTTTSTRSSDVQVFRLNTEL
jgi:hypothetical protein